MVTSAVATREDVDPWLASSLVTAGGVFESAFVGPDVQKAGGIWQVARLHAQSMSLLARDTGDRAIAQQAETLQAVVGTAGPY